jgi:hypothetical protein
MQGAQLEAGNLNAVVYGVVLQGGKDNGQRVR